MENYRILVINPGSTSTKVSYHINKECIFKADVFHDSGELLKFGSINDQLDYRMEMLEAFLAEHDIHELDAVVGRGGGCYSVESGTYYVDEQLIKDTREYKGGLYHSSMLGVQMAERVQKMMGGVMLMVDPPVVDELDMKARITGVKGIYRTAICHALNLKEVAKVHARSMGKNYEDLNLIVCH
ncbi:MAG: butyrate kinase, partial [Erysipelotrichaceae bacterium]|nr:butyrate kinase [Erysipelotrichaceae bacterium]